MSAFSSVTVGSLVASKTGYVISVNSGDSIEDVLKLLSKHRILSAPVLHEGAYIAFTTVFDIANFVVSFVSRGQLNQTEEEIQAMAKKHLSRPILDVLGLTRETQTLWSYDADDSLAKVFEAFSKGVHRVLVTKDGKPLNILTQSDVLKFLNKNIDTLKDVDLPILKTGLFRELKVLSLNHHKPAVHGFSLMVMHEVKAIPILDDYEKLVATLSSSDLRGLLLSDFSKLALPVTEFLKIQYPDKPREQISCKSTSTLREIITLLISNKLHRVWVLDENDKVVSVVSLSDIMTKFSPYDHLQPQA